MADRTRRKAAIRARRRTLQWPMLVALVLIWVLFWGDLSFANVLSGLLVAVIVAMVFPLPPIRFAGRLRPFGVLRLLGRFVTDLVAASFGVAWQALNARHQPMTAIIEVRLHARSDLYLTLTAELLSLIPGSVVVEADRPNWTLYLHVLGARTDDDVARARARALAQEERLVRALASDAELAEFVRSRTEGG